MRSLVKESDIQRAILDFLQAKKILAWRCNMGAVLVSRDSKIRFSKNPNKGIPDIGGVLQGGRYFAIEVKRPGGRLSPEQKGWIERLSAQGVICIVATSVEDVRRGLSA